jgi:hypothetical protein
MNRYEIWVSRIGELGASSFYCGDVPKIGTTLNGRKVRLVVPQPNNTKQFLAILEYQQGHVAQTVAQNAPVGPFSASGCRLPHA